MAITHKNRRDDIYYLHQGKTKTGKSKYYFSKKKDGVLAESIPEGFEIYESPSAQVFLRKIPPKIIADEEVAIIENGIRRFSHIKDFKIDVRKNTVTIFLPNRDVDELSNSFGAILPFASPQSIFDIIKRTKEYRPLMRFVLLDQENREFSIERWCFLGSIDDWITLEESSDLRKLTKTYCRHLGKESFYDLV